MGRRKSGKGKLPSQPAATNQVCDGWLWWRSAPGAPQRPKQDIENPKKIPVDVKAELHSLMRRYRAGQMRDGVDVKPLGKGILELRYKKETNPYRLLFFRWGRFAVVLDVFYKNQQKTDTALAEQRMGKWKQTFGPKPPPPAA